MRKLAALLVFIATIKSRIEVLEPTNLKHDIHSGSEGAESLEYSVSTFGHVLYHEKIRVEVVFPGSGNPNGCDNLTHPRNLDARKFVWLVERGVCTYSKKAFISQQSGAFAVLVYHDSFDVDIKNVIPCADAICSLKRQPRQNPHHPHQQEGRAKNPKGTRKQPKSPPLD